MIYSKVTEKDLDIQRKLAEQQKKQRALKIKNRISKQTHDVKLAESLSPITKKLDKINKSTKKIGEVIKGSNSENENNQEVVPVEIESEDENIQTNLRALPKSSMFSDQMTKTLGRLMISANSLKTKSTPSGATILGVPINTLGGDRIQIRDNIYDLTPEIYKALSYTGYDGKTMKKENDILMLKYIIRDLGYTGIGDNKSKKITFLTEKLPKLVEESQNKTFEEFTDDSDDLQGEGFKIIIPSNIIDIYTKLEVLLGLELSRHTDILPEASNLIDELYNEVRYKTKNNIEMLLTNFQLSKWNYFRVNYLNK